MPENEPKERIVTSDEEIKNNSQGGEQESQVDTEEHVHEPDFTAGTSIKLEELKEEKEYDEEEFEHLKGIYSQTLNDIVEGEIVKGKVLAINEREITVDIGFKSEGSIPIEEFSSPEEIKVGDEIEVFLDNIEDAEGQLVLSKRKADFVRTWEKIVELYERGETIDGKIVRRIKGGMVVDLMGVDAFLPGSQIDVKPVRDFDALVGRQMTFKVVNVNHLRRNIVVSRRVLIEEKLKGQREKILAELERGQIREGTVKNITDFGVFIDLGGVDGLLHINDLSWGRVSHPSEIVALDEKIKVMILDFDENKQRISLGLKQLQPHPWEKVEEKYPVGSKVKGKVVNISDYGAFVELEKGVEGLVHISEMSWTQHIKHPSQIVSLGETVEAVVLNIEKEERRISLGLKQLEPDPWEHLEKKYPVGSKHKGTVQNLANFGAFVELEEGVDGLIHISDLSWTKKVRHPSEIVKKGDTIEVVILNIDKASRRISLGLKQIEENPWDRFEQEYKVGTLTSGKVVRSIEKGLIVNLPLEVEGFVPLSQLIKVDKQQGKKTADVYKPGDELQLVVIEFDKTNKRIVLSEKKYVDHSEEKQETKEPVEEDKVSAKEEKTEATALKEDDTGQEKDDKSDDKSSEGEE